MIYFREKNDYCKIEFIGYEFDNSEFEEDLNWVVIKIEARSHDFEWTAMGPFIRTYELLELKNWFSNSFLNLEETDYELTFLEQELSFEYDALEAALLIFLNHSFHPKGEDFNQASDDRFVMKFHLKNDDGVEVIRGLENICADFPPRKLGESRRAG